MPSDGLALSGTRVIEMSHMIMGPSCGLFLALMGAEVIKIEPPGGDKTRNLTGMGSGFFPTFNRGKKSVVLDLNTESDRGQLNELLTDSDVFVENFRDGSLEEKGLAPDQLRRRFPRLIIASCKGFLHGPYENRTAMDEVVQMMTGMAYMTGPTGQPLRIGSSAVDIMGGLFCAYAVLGELFRRQESGVGATVRSGLFESCLLLVAQHMAQFDIEGTEAPPMPERAFAWPVYDIFETRDGKQLFVGAVTAGHWKSLCEILDISHLLHDPRLNTKMDQIEARVWTIPLVADAIAKRDRDELTVRFEPVGIPFSPIHRPSQMYDDPHVNRPGGLLTSELPDGNSCRLPGLPVEVNGRSFAPASIDVPGLGDHTNEILGRFDKAQSE
ncbi:MAG: CoA transferase [Pseudomonadota bacterium]